MILRCNRWCQSEILVIISIIIFTWFWWKRKRSIRLWGEIAREWNSSIIKIKRSIFANTRYQLHYKGHKISFSPGPILWFRSPYYTSIFIDHTYPGKIEIDISAKSIFGISSNDHNFDSKFRVKANDAGAARYLLNPNVKAKILKLVSGEIYIRPGYLQYVKSGFITDKEYLKNVIEKLIHIADTIAK